MGRARSGEVYPRLDGAQAPTPHSWDKAAAHGLASQGVVAEFISAWGVAASSRRLGANKTLPAGVLYFGRVQDPSLRSSSRPCARGGDEPRHYVNL